MYLLNAQMKLMTYTKMLKGIVSLKIWSTASFGLGDCGKRFFKNFTDLFILIYLGNKLNNSIFFHVVFIKRFKRSVHLILYSHYSILFIFYFIHIIHNKRELSQITDSHSDDTRIKDIRKMHETPDALDTLEKYGYLTSQDIVPCGQCILFQPKTNIKSLPWVEHLRNNQRKL